MEDEEADGRYIQQPRCSSSCSIHRRFVSRSPLPYYYQQRSAPQTPPCERYRHQCFGSNFVHSQDCIRLEEFKHYLTERLLAAQTPVSEQPPGCDPSVSSDHIGQQQQLHQHQRPTSRPTGPKGDLLDAFRLFARETSAHGFRWTVGATSNMRVAIWSALIACAIVMACFSVYSVTLDYINGPRFSSEYNLVSGVGFLPQQVQGIRVPDLVVCSPSPWDETKIISQNVSYDMVSYLNYVINPFNSNPLLFRDKNRVIHMEIEYLRLLKNRYDNNLLFLLNNLTVSCEDFLVMCKEGLRPPLCGQRCCKEIFDSKGVFTFDGKCFTTQGVMKFDTYFPAKSQGVIVTVRHSSSDITSRLNPHVSNWLSISRQGVAFAVTDNLTHPTISLMQRGNGARKNTVTDVPIHKETIDFTNTLSDTWMMPKRCIRSYDQEGMSLVPGFKHFSIENCKVAKVQRAANHFMGCNILAIPQNNPAPLRAVKFYEAFRRLGTRLGRTWFDEEVDVINENEVMEEAKKYHGRPGDRFGTTHMIPYFGGNMTDEEFVKFLAMQDFFEHLVQNRKTSYTTYRCPRDCEHNYYRTSISSFDMTDGFRKIFHIKYQAAKRRGGCSTQSQPAGPEEHGHRDLGNASRRANEKKDDLQTSEFSMLEFFFPSFDFTRIVQHRRGPLEWLADIGGSLGLYLGASLFTIAEIVWFCSKVFFCSLSKAASSNGYGV